MSKLFHVRTANQCMRDAQKIPIPKMLFDELWFEQEVCILFADSNVGKTILAMQIAESISRGVTINGFGLEAQAQGVLFCDFELSDKQFENRFTENYQNPYMFSDDLLRLCFSKNLTKSKVTEEDIFQEIKQELLENNAKILVVDNITYLSGESLENAKEANALMKVLKQLKNEMELSILIVAHSPKKYAHRPLRMSDLAGSAGLSRFADSIFAMGKSSVEKGMSYIKQLKVRSTEFKYDGDNVITVKVEKHGNFLKVVHKGTESEQNHISSEANSDLEGEILSFSKKNPEMTQREVADELGCDKMKVNRTLKKYRGDPVSK